MKRTLLALTMLLTILVLAGCGDNGGGPPPAITTQILSDSRLDGDISKDQAGTFTVTQGNTQNILVGIDPVTGAEFRGFLDFPLGGAGGVPGNAIISSAILDITIDDILPPLPLSSSIPIRIDLVSFQQPMRGSDFDVIILPALISTTISPPISQTDVRNHVAVNVTPLMVEAQRRGLPSLQLRILQELGPGIPVVIQINDTTGVNREIQAPLLEVTYF